MLLHGVMIAAFACAVAAGQQESYSERRFVIRTGGNDTNGVFSVRKNSSGVCGLRLELSRALDCRKEYVVVGGGGGGNLCGDKSYEIPFADDEVVIAYGYGADSRYGGRSLEIRGEQLDCEDVVRELHGEIVSPNYPDAYPPRLDYRIRILPVSDAACEVAIAFHDFDVEASPDCVKDRLLVGNVSLCGSRPGHRVADLAADGAVLRFQTDDAGSGRGFAAHVRQIPCGGEHCCGRVYRDRYAILVSPGFLVPTRIDVDCRYTLLARNSSRLRIRFRRFWIPDGDGFLEIDGRRFTGCLDGREHSTEFDDGRKSLRLRYSGTGLRGFALEVLHESSPDPNTEVEVFARSRGLECRDWGLPDWTEETLALLEGARCGERDSGNVVPESCVVLDAERGFLATPFFPWPYPHNLRQCFEFPRSPGYCGVRIGFHEFDLERSWQCAKDHLLVGGRRFCGRALAGREVSLRLRSAIHFASDGTVNGRGFLAEYSLLRCRGFD